MAAFLSVLAAAVGLFLVWNGLLWNAPREASHVARFVVSYLAVVPLGALLLLALHRFSWAHLITSTGAVWAIKMVVTAALYQAFARGTATELHGVAPPTTATTAAAHPPRDYGTAASFASGGLRGRVRRGGKGLAFAVVFLDAPAPGRAAPAPRKVELVISGSRYAEPLYLAHVEDEVLLLNHDGVLHTAHVSGSGRLPPNRPMPPSAEAHVLPLTEPGVYHVRCDNHAGEATWIVVVDHPYAVRTSADGTFSLEGVPAGDARVVAVAAEGVTGRRGGAHVLVRASETAELTIDLDAAPEISP